MSASVSIVVCVVCQSDACLSAKLNRSHFIVYEIHKETFHVFSFFPLPHSKQLFKYSCTFIPSSFHHFFLDQIFPDVNYMALSLLLYYILIYMQTWPIQLGKNTNRKCIEIYNIWKSNGIKKVFDIQNIQNHSMFKVSIV